MAWTDAPQFEARLNRALRDFNWSEAGAIVAEIRGRLRVEPELLPERSAKILLQALRGKRQFTLMSGLAEDLLQSGLRTPQVRRQYAQALIDQGVLAAAEMVLQSIVHDPQGIKGEELEARGLTGRIYKQLYVNNQDPRSPRNRENLERALSEYFHVYRLDPDEHVWHGINVVALAKRAQRDELSIAGLPDASELSQRILATLAERERQSTKPLPAWDIATAMEAQVALRADHDAVESALRYVEAAGDDAFEINSTIRQLTEVWQLSDHEPPGNHLLPILRAAHLLRQGSAATSNPKSVADEAAAVASAVNDLEAVFGSDRMVTLKWYEKGLQQCSSIARVERLNGRGHGTGWVVNARDFFADRAGVLLLTNNHVVSDPPSTLAIRPDQARVNFQALGEICEVEDTIVWSSPVAELDATFLALKRVPSAPPMTLHAKPAAMAEPAPRMYIIGHPGGRDLELSLQDNHLVGCNERFLHYRTPTERGSSGSPVFEPEDWRVIALHHRGPENMPRLDGQGTYDANEGIAMLAIQKAIRGG
jgi:hypothetical protein